MDGRTEAPSHTTACAHRPAHPSEIEEIDRWSMIKGGQAAAIAEMIGPEATWTAIVILGLIGSTEGSTTASRDHIAAITGYSKGTVRRHTRKLTNTQLLVITNNGRRISAGPALRSLTGSTATVEGRALPLDRWAKITGRHRQQIASIVGPSAAFTCSMVLLLTGTPTAKWSASTTARNHQLAKLMRTSEGTIRRHLTILYDAGLVDKTGAGRGRRLIPGAVLCAILDVEVVDNTPKLDFGETEQRAHFARVEPVSARIPRGSSSRRARKMVPSKTEAVRESVASNPEPVRNEGRVDRPKVRLRPRPTSKPFDCYRCSEPVGYMRDGEQRFNLCAKCHRQNNAHGRNRARAVLAARQLRNSPTPDFTDPVMFEQPDNPVETSAFR